MGRRGAGGDPVGKGMGGLVGGPPPLTTAPGSRRSCADSPRLSASRRYSPGSCRHFSLLELSDPASAQGHSTYGCHRVTPHTSNNPPTPPPSTLPPLPTRGGGGLRLAAAHLQQGVAGVLLEEGPGSFVPPRVRRAHLHLQLPQLLQAHGQIPPHGHQTLQVIQARVVVPVLLRPRTEEEE